MNSEIKEMLDQVVADRKLLKRKMIWEVDTSAMATLAAFLFASAGKKADVDRYVECKKYLKKNVNIFSEFRGIAQVIVITKMCLSENYEEYLKGLTTVYKKLRSIHKLTASPYMVLAAINIFEAGGVEKADENIDKLETVYKEMKAEHFWLTGGEDRPFLAMMVSRDMDYLAISKEVSACYEASKNLIISKEAMHTASQIMALSSKDVDTKVENLKATKQALKANKVGGMKSILMPLAAVLGLIDETPDAKAAEIKEIYDYLKKQPGFKWYIGRTERSMYSILAYAIGNLDEDKTSINSVISTTVTNIIIDEIIMMVLIMTSTSVNSTTSSSSN